MHTHRCSACNLLHAVHEPHTVHASTTEMRQQEHGGCVRKLWKNRGKSIVLTDKQTRHACMFGRTVFNVGGHLTNRQTNSFQKAARSINFGRHVQLPIKFIYLESSRPPPHLNPPFGAATQTKRVPIRSFSKQASICILIKT